MLNDLQIKRVWENMLAAEALSLYFGDLASRYTMRKQWITGVSFFLSSGAAATIIAKAPSWVPLTLALIVAAVTAYSMAVNLDGKIGTMVKLHSTWNRIKIDYEQLWNHAYAEDAEDRLDGIIQLEEEPSELATTDAPNDQKLLKKWQDRVFVLHGLTDRHA
ncbi:MAG: hypothetical protein ACYDDI_00210 [Candidatus Acidiferrales bacterium]